MNIGIFAAGCFGSSKKFDLTAGVEKTEVGYTGGTIKNPTYEQVCYEETGHAEAIKVYFDEKKITYRELLDVFWKIHDPTTLNRQGPDIGDQYRSAIFYLNTEQKKNPKNLKKANKDIFDNKIVTQIVKAEDFYLAEEYHQKYLKKLGRY